ncbi:unnamed protein product [Gongylonema pulchrum]|uniref:PNTB domain-containing protein n=1 Tax=Gongylonema pulchrum TaxID=637853 RepID=A0A183D5Q8_9BILA|nr:unnamed protein product [Gongylonema pulchrum]
MFNPIASGGLTGAFLAVRSGPMVMMGSAAVGAVIVGMIEVASLAMGKFAGMVMDPNSAPQELEDPAVLSAKQPQQKHAGSSGASSGVSADTSSPSAPFSLAQPY